MKQILFIIGLFVSALLFVPEDEAKSLERALLVSQETVMEECESTESQRYFEVLSNHLNSSNILAPRRVTSNKSIFSSRFGKILEKHLHGMRLKGENQLHKVFAHSSIDQTVYLSSLICRMGEHVFALRKLII